MRPLFLLLLGASLSHAAPLQVHEWGTFTSLQNDRGEPIAGINIDDEPVPAFVHDVARGLVVPSTATPPALSKSVARCHPDVTMRLETPVLYCHGDAPGPIEVSVDFRGGWLTQFYPNADTAGAPETPAATLTADTVGNLTWPALILHSDGRGPTTQDRVWLSPRAVRASWIRSSNGEMEKFLFYRGVGHLDAPLRVRREGHTLTITSSPESPSASAIRQAWLVEIRPDGTAAFHEISMPAGSGSATETFEPAQFQKTGARQLRVTLCNALVADGLFADEAEALLDTWEASYFKSAGLRLFFLVPSAWTDAVLPVRITGDPPITRVMVGRIELLSPVQRELLARLSTSQPAEGDLPAYAALGRFRDALLLEELRRRPTAALRSFATRMGLTTSLPDR